jgi:hypothetical protein
MAILSRQPIQRQPGYLYYVGKDGYVWASPMKTNTGGEKHRVGNEQINRGGKMCFINKQGYVENKG